jgi:DNA-binding response OmpR family regulator
MLERVLIVDEDVKVRDFLYEVMTEVGFRALTVPTGSEGLERLKKERPVLVIIDDVPGEFSGIPLAKKIRSFDKDIRIIMLGLKPKVLDLKDQIAEANISAYLSKDFQDPTVIKTIISVVKLDSGAKAQTEKIWGRVLIVDDEYESREMVGNYLRRRGFETDSASSGEECIEKLRMESFDVVVLDVTMNGMDGLLTLKRIKDANPNVFVIMATALGNKDVISQAQSMGASDYIIKPFNLGLLESSLLSLLLTKKIEKKSP